MDYPKLCTIELMKFEDLAINVLLPLIYSMIFQTKKKSRGICDAVRHWIITWVYPECYVARFL